MNEKLWYYTDKYGKDDTLTTPACRPYERCLNCNKGWGEHVRWACDTNRATDNAFDDLRREQRYLTASMSLAASGMLRGTYAYMYDVDGTLLPSYAQVQEEKVSKPTSSFTGPDLSDWRTWAKVPPGHCACNVRREVCPTHKHDM